MYHNLDDVVFWLKFVALLLFLTLLAFLLFGNRIIVVSPTHDESWKPFPEYDGTQEH